MKNYYRILSIDVSAQQNEIKKSYYDLAKAFHPDKNDNQSVNNEFMADLSEAYEVLSDPTKRKAYDKIYHQLFSHNYSSKDCKKEIQISVSSTRARVNRNRIDSVRSDAVTPKNKHGYSYYHDNYYKIADKLRVVRRFIYGGLLCLVFGIIMANVTDDSEFSVDGTEALFWALVFCTHLVLIAITYFLVLVTRPKPLDLLDPFLKYERMTLKQLRYLLLRRASPINFCDRDGVTPLMLASRHCKNTKVLYELIQKGAYTTVLDDYGNSCFDHSFFNKSVKVSKFYIDSSNTPPYNYNNIFSIISIGRIDILEYVFNDLDIRILYADPDEYTEVLSAFLMWAAMTTINPMIIEVLLEYGADGSYKDENGRTSFDLVDFGDNGKANINIRHSYAYELLRLSQFRVLSNSEISSIKKKWRK